MCALTELLREATRPQHERLHHLVDLSSMKQGPAEYGRGLLKYWQFVAPLESQLHGFLDAHHMDDGLWQTRLVKRQWLQRDLQTLQIDLPDEPSTPAAAPELHSLADFVGISYVLEGMTLGGQGISKQIERQYPEWAGQATHFFRSYGSDTVTRWRAWQQWANAQPVDAQQTIDVAGKTFDYFVNVWSDVESGGS